MVDFLAACCGTKAEDHRLSIILFKVDKFNVNLAYAKCTYLHRTIFFRNYPALYWRWQSIKAIRVKLTPTSCLTTTDSRTVLWPVEMDGTSGRTFVLVQVVLPIPPPKEVLIKAGDGVTVEASTLTSGGNVAGSSPRHYATNTELIVVDLEFTTHRPSQRR